MLGSGLESIMRNRIAALLIVAMAALPAAAQEITLRGKIVDVDGKPAAGIEVANFWIGKRDFLGFGKGITMTAHGSAVTDSDGKFAVKVPGWLTEPALLAVSADRKTGAMASVKAKETTDVPTMTLKPLVKVTGNFDSKELGHKPPWTNVYINTMQSSRLVQSDSRRADFAFLLPPGKYKFDGYGSDVKSARREIEVPADKPELDLGTIDLPATEIAKHVGKAPPAWHVTDARGAKKEVTLADYKGKWVMIEFWGFW